MKINKGKIVLLILIFISLASIDGITYAHSGRTDAYGGHKDNKNVSGLGNYHYHCGGYPAHLHPNGVCPYASTTSNSSKNEEKELNPTSIEINEEITEMTIGESKKLTVKILPENATENNITWKSSDENVISINTVGELISKKEGTAEITVKTGNGKLDTIRINVKKKENIEDNNNLVASSTDKYTGNNNVLSNESHESGSAGVIFSIILLGLIVYGASKKMKK